MFFLSKLFSWQVVLDVLIRWWCVSPWLHCSYCSTSSASTELSAIWADGQAVGKSWLMSWAAESRSTVDPWYRKSEWKRQHLCSACKVVMLRNSAEYRFNRDPRWLESLRNIGVWKHQSKWMLRPFGKFYNEPVGNSAFLWSLAALLWVIGLFDNMKAMLCVVCSCSDFSDVPWKLLAGWGVCADSVYTFCLSQFMCLHEYGKRCRKKGSTI